MSVMNYEVESENYIISTWYGGDYFEICTPFCTTSRGDIGTMRVDSRERMSELYLALCDALTFINYKSNWFNIYSYDTNTIQIESDTITATRGTTGAILITKYDYIIELVNDIADVLYRTQGIRYKEVV